MEEIKFKIKSPPFSINQAYYKRSFTRTSKCREWGAEILLQLQAAPIQKKLKKIKKWAKIELHLLYHYPEAILYTKKGKVSRRSMDLSNIEKLLIDLIFDKRYNGRVIDGVTIKNADVDDCLIIKLISEKRLSKNDDYYIDIILKEAE